MSASHAKTVTETDVVMFAGLTGDNNPIHCNEVFAAQTQFKSRIAHGMFCAGLISCVAGTRLPGPGAVYVDQQLRFKAPVRIGDTVTAVCTIREINPERRRVIMNTICTVQRQGRGRRNRHVHGQPPQSEQFAASAGGASLFHDHPKPGHRVAVAGFAGQALGRTQFAGAIVPGAPAQTFARRLAEQPCSSPP